MKTAIYSTYLDTLGGGERYLATIAEFLSQKNEVNFFWDDKSIISELQERFGLSFGKVKVVPNIFSKKTNFFKRFAILRSYNFAIFLSDGSIPTPMAKHNILHFQVPFTLKNGRNLLNRIKLLGYKVIVCNSEFTKNHIDKTYGVSSKVIYPPVDTSFFEPKEKKNVILSVGRFTKIFGGKKQEVLIEVFKKMVKEGLERWELILIGGADDLGYVEKLKSQTEEFPIQILTNISVLTLRKFYGEAKIYWHAAGFDEDLERYPEKAEHFGISVVEAMSAGCVPVVFAAGGIPEIIDSGSNGFRWERTEDLIAKTKRLIEDHELLEKFAQAARSKAKKFSKECFCEEFEKLLQ
jgi:glycosyltransferase involved in cell wall biosynthesis